MIRIFLMLIVGLGILLCSLSSIAAVPQFFLVQNSGWMQPYFSDKNANFSEIVARLVQMSCRGQNAPSVLAVFNQAKDPTDSPKTLYEGTCSAMPVQQLVATMHAARLAGNPNVFANSDYRQALYRAITRYAKGQSAIIWMVTNNKNSPYNSQALSAHDATFYQMLHDSPEVQKVVALPLVVNAQSSYFHSHGLIIFGIAYGQAAAAALQQILSDGLVRKYFGTRAALLKPLNVSAVRFDPTKVTGAASKVVIRHGILDIDLPARDSVQRFNIYGHFINVFYPYSISYARPQAALLLSGKQYLVPLTPNQLQDLAPGVPSAPVRLSFTVPPTPTWSLSTIIGNDRTIPAVIDFSLRQQKLTISPQFIKIIDQILPDSPIPTIFQPDTRVSSSQTKIPIDIIIHYPIWPLLVVLVLLALFLVGVAWLVYRMAIRGATGVKVRVDGKISTHRLALRQTQKLRNSNGEVVGELSRGLFGYRVTKKSKDVNIELVKK